jgi:ANTAR domain
MPSGNLVDTQVDGAVDGHACPSGMSPSGMSSELALLERVAELEKQLEQLREALPTRQQLGLVTGLVAQRYGLAPDEAWALLIRISQNLNVKLREVGQVVLDGYCGQLARHDEALVRRVDAYSPSGRSLVMAKDR